MTLKPSVTASFKHPIIVQTFVLIVVAMVTSYLAVAQASIPRKDAVELINQSELRSHEMIEKLDSKQDEILDKLEQMQIDIAVIKQKVGK